MAGKKDDKKMICLRKWADQGKSKTIKALARILMPNEKDMRDAEWHDPDKFTKETSYQRMLEAIEAHDICVIKKVDGKRVGLTSFGDTPEQIEANVGLLIEEKCDIIFCVCRSKGEPITTVRNLAKNKYKLIWTAPYTDDSPPAEKPTPFQQFLNEKKAEHLKEFIYL